LQKIAGDILGVERLGELLTQVKNSALASSEGFDVEMLGAGSSGSTKHE